MAIELSHDMHIATPTKLITSVPVEKGCMLRDIKACMDNLYANVLRDTKARVENLCML